MVEPDRELPQPRASGPLRDFRSSFASGARDTDRSHEEWSGALAVFWGGSLEDPELTRQVNDTIGRGLYLVELSTGAPVRGTVREGVVRLDGEVVPGWPDGEVLGVMSFVPTQPLDDGWYVLVADLREGWRRARPYRHASMTRTTRRGRHECSSASGSDPTRPGTRAA